MTGGRTPAVCECLHCGVEFTPRKWGHVFCSIACRHRGERAPHDRVQTDHDAVARLFDPSRDPESRVRLDDWFPGSDEAREIYAVDTIEARRRWFLELQRRGRL